MKLIFISFFLFMLNCQNNKHKIDIKNLPNYFLDSSEFKNGIQNFYLVRKVSEIKLDTILTIKSIEGTAEISSKNVVLETDSLFFIKIYNEPVGSKQSIIYKSKNNQLYRTEIYDSDAIGDNIEINSTNFKTQEVLVKSENGNYKIKFISLPTYSTI